MVVQCDSGRQTESWPLRFSLGTLYSMTAINWQNTDVMTPEDLFLSVRFIVIGGKAKIVDRNNEVVARGKVVDWRHSGESRLYFATLEDGTRWEVVKLRCKCSDKEKSGRIWG